MISAGIPSLNAIEQGQVIQTLGELRMLWSKDLLLYAKGGLKEGPGQRVRGSLTEIAPRLLDQRGSLGKGQCAPSRSASATWVKRARLRNRCNTPPKKFPSNQSIWGMFSANA